MSIQGMRRRFAVHLRYVLYGIIAVFIIGLPFVFTPGLTPPGEEEAAEGERAALARVDGVSVSRGRVDRIFTGTLKQVLPLYQQMGVSLGLRQLADMRLEAFQQAVMQELIRRQAEAEKLSVSKGEVRQAAERVTNQQLDAIKAQYQGQELERMLAQLYAQAEGRTRQRMSEAAFRKWSIKRILTQAEDELREELLTQKLRQQVTGSVTVTEEDLRASYDRLTLREIFVSLQPRGKPARTDEEARKRAQDLVAKARAGADFAQLAKAESDTAGAKETGGLQDPMPLSAMPRDIQKAVAGLKEGQVADPVKVARGYSIVKLEKRTRELPKDYEKNKADLLRQFTEQRRDQVWQEYMNSLRQKAKIEVLDPEILGYQAMQQRKKQDAVKYLREAAAKAMGDQIRGLPAGAIHFSLASLLEEQGKLKEALDSYTAAVDAISQDEQNPLPDARAEALMALARVSERLGKAEDALLWYQEASNWSDTPQLHRDLLDVFQRLNMPKLVKSEQDWLAQYEQAQAEQQRALEEAQRKAAEQARPQQRESQPAPPRR